MVQHTRPQFGDVTNCSSLSISKSIKAVMDGRSFEHESNAISKKMKGASSCHGGVDMISHLPEDVIVHILSFLSLKEAANTSVLSSKWLDMWKHISNLVFVSKCHASKMAERYRLGHEYHEWVDSVLKSHKAFSLKEFTISIVVKESTQCAVTKWHEPVNSRQVVRLELNFRLPGGKDRAVLGERLGESNYELKSLKEMCVKNFEVSREAINVFLCKCPLLERLTIHGSIMAPNVDPRKSTKQGVERFPHQHLRVFKHFGYDEVVEECVRYVADNCVVLREVVIDPQSLAASMEANICLGGFPMRFPRHVFLHIY